MLITKELQTLDIPIKMIKSSGLWLYIALLIYSCNAKRDVNAENNIRRTYYNDGKIRAEATYNSDSLKHGYGKLFYPNGQLELEVAYKNGKKEGYEKCYYIDGSLDYVGTNRNDHPVGQHLSYYPDGTSKNYILFDPVGRAVYKREYTSKGIFLSDEGSKNTQIISVTTADNHFLVGDTLHVRIYAPTPKDVEVSLRIKITNEESRVLEEKFVKIAQGYASYKQVLLETGSYHFTTYFTFSDRLTESEEENKNSFQYWVNKP